MINNQNRYKPFDAKKMNQHTQLYSNPQQEQQSTSFLQKVGGLIGKNFKEGNLNGFITTGSNILSNALSNGMDSNTGNVMSSLGTMAAALPGHVGAGVSAGFNILGGITNALWGSKVNQQFVNTVRNQTQQLSNTEINASNNSDLVDQASNITFMGNVKKSDVGKEGLFSNKVTNLTRKINKEIDYANLLAQNSILNSVNNIRTQEQLGRNYAAFGGYLNNKKAFGGNLLTNGAVWDNGVTVIGNGGTHEDNPMEGVPMGVDEQGIPNLVEEGEVIFNDYVFSNRLSPTKEMKKKYKYKGDTFADVAKNLQKESEERPNDPISKRGLQDSMLKLQNLQEIIRQESNSIGVGNKFDKGGTKQNPYSLRNSHKFLTDRNGFKFPIPLDLSNINNNYNIDKDIKGNLRPSINNITFGYSNWDDFRVDSLALEKDLSRRQSKNLYNHIKNNQFGYNSKYPFHTKNSIQNYIQKVFDLQYPDKPIINKNNNTKYNNSNSKVSSSSNTQHISKKPQVYKNNTKQDKPISTKVPYFPINRIEPLGIDESWNNIKDKSLFLYPENISFQKYEDPIVPINSKVSRDIQQIPLSKQALLEIPYNNENNNFMRDYQGDLEELKRNQELTGLKSNTVQSPSLEEFNQYNKKHKRTVNNKKSFDLSSLRYAPVLGAAIGLSNSLFNKPDYSSADALLKASRDANRYSPISYSPIGDYMQYNPFDRDFYATKLRDNFAATNRALLNSSQGSRAAAVSSLLSNNYNYQTKLGDLYRQAEEYNLAQKQKVADFNRATNMANAEMGLKVSMANQDALMKSRQGNYQGIMNAIQMRDAIDARRGASLNANLSNLFTSLGNVGIDYHNRKDRDFYIENVAPNLPLSEIDRLYGREAVNKAAKDRGISQERLKELGFSKGGKLNIKNKKRKGFTI